MNLCSMTGNRGFGTWKRGRQKDDRPFSGPRKQIYPIRGFKGNRIIYGDSFDSEDQAAEEGSGTYFVENTEFHHKNLNNIDREEPIYSEPIFTLPEHTSVRQNIVTSLIKKLETNIEHESQLDFYSKHQSKGDNELEEGKEAGVYRCKDEYRNQNNVDDKSDYLCRENDKLEYSGDNDDGDNLIYKDDHDQYMYQYLLSRGLVTKSNSAGFLISQCLASSHSPDSGYLSYPRYQHTGSLSSNTNSTSSNQEEHDKPNHKPDGVLPSNQSQTLSRTDTSLNSSQENPSSIQSTHPSSFPSSRWKHQPGLPSYQPPPPVTSNCSKSYQPSVSSGYHSRTPDVTSGYLPPLPDVPSGYQPNLPDASMGYPPSLPNVQNGYQPNVPDASIGYPPSLPIVQNGYQTNIPDMSSGYQPNLPDVSSGYQPNLPDVSRGYQSNLPDVSNGYQPNLPDVPSGYQHYLSNGSNGYQTSIHDVSSGYQPSFPNESSRHQSTIPDMPNGYQSTLPEVSSEYNIDQLDISNGYQPTMPEMTNGYHPSLPIVSNEYQPPLPEMTNGYQPYEVSEHQHTFPAVSSLQNGYEPPQSESFPSNDSNHLQSKTYHAKPFQDFPIIKQPLKVSNKPSNHRDAPSIPNGNGLAPSPFVETPPSYPSFPHPTFFVSPSHDTPPPLPRSKPPAIPENINQEEMQLSVRSNTLERQKIREKHLVNEMKKSHLANIEDLIHLQGPLTEDAILKTLQARFANENYQTHIGPILLCMNPYKDVGNQVTLESTKNAAKSCSTLHKVAQETIRIQGDTGYPQAIILSGNSGSGKTYSSMVLLRQLFNVAGGGPETDVFKHLTAAFTVLRSLGSAKTSCSREASRIGHFIEVAVSEGALYRSRIHCYFLDQTRVVKPLATERNYHIFYQMMAGLSNSDKEQLGLQDFSYGDLRYLNQGDLTMDADMEAKRFEDWKANLAVLGIPFMDVIRVMSTILLLGNVQFLDGNGPELDLLGKEELEAAASLIGVTSDLLLQGITTRTHNVRGQLIKSDNDADVANSTRDALAKALYCRTVATIVKRANSLKKPVGPLTGSLSSNESVHHESSGTTTSGSKSMSILNNAVRQSNDGFIGVLDMFGFEDSKPSQLEQLCINLASETMQHFYNTHTLKTAIETCKEEGIECEVEVDYADNAHCIDLISSLRTGLLKMLDVECSVWGSPKTYVQKLKVQHKNNQRLFEPPHCDSKAFGIQHYAGNVVYDTTNFLETNRDFIPDDLVSVFHKKTCKFGFATHLFASEVKTLYSEDTVPRGATFRISPTSQPDQEPVSTLTQDFHTRLDNLLRTLVHAKPHFIRCIRPNDSESSTEFNRTLVRQQVRSLQVLETVNLMAGGFPHRMRFKNFMTRYRVLVGTGVLDKESNPMDDCETVLTYLTPLLNSDHHESSMARNWALGKKHVFLSEGARQSLEELRCSRRNKAASQVQALWRGHSVRRSWSHICNKLQLQRSRLRPKPITGTPEPGLEAFQRGLSPSVGSIQPEVRSVSEMKNRGDTDQCDIQTIQRTCSLFGLDLERPPPLPPSRRYTVMGNRKVTYPQTRVMRTSFPENGTDTPLLEKGETVIVTGTSSRRGHLVVEKNNHTIHLPHQILECLILETGAQQC